jgi:ribbon-helix-helix CopG family protein
MIRNGARKIMAHQITLTDEDYAKLAAAAARTGSSVAELLHQAIAERFSSQRPAKQTGSYQYPTGEPDTPEEEAEDEELARLVGPGKPWLSEMVIEDRGPR